MSPSAITSGWPSIVRSGPTATRQVRSSVASLAAASAPASSLATTPAAQTIVRVDRCMLLPSGTFADHRVVVEVDDGGVEEHADPEPCDLACHLNARRTASHDHEGEPGLAQLLILLVLGFLERGEDPPPDRERALHRLDLERERPPLVA